MRLDRTARLISTGLIIIFLLSTASLANLVFAENQACFSSTAVHQFCIFQEYTGLKMPRAITVSPDFRMLAATSPETNTSVFSLTEGYLIREIPESSAYGLAFSPDSQTLAIGADDKISLWNVSSRLINRVLEGQEGGIFSLAFSPDGNLLASGGEGTIHLWKLPEGHLLDTAQDNDLHFVDAIKELTFSPDGTHLVSTSVEGGKVWEIEDESQLVLKRILNPRADTADFSPDGKMLAVSGVGMDIEIYDTTNFTLMKIIPFRSSPDSNRGTSTLRFIDGGDALVVGELGIDDYTAGLQVIDVQSSETVLALDGSGTEVYAIETAFDGQFAIGLTSGVSDYIIYWRLEE